MPDQPDTEDVQDNATKDTRPRAGEPKVDVGSLDQAEHDERLKQLQQDRHSEEEWVIGDVHTNGIEGVWSLFKRSIVGTFHKMSVKHLDRYLEELEWRFNNRNNPHIFRDALLRIVNNGNLTYRRLIDGERNVPIAA